uniref:C-type lectin domain-containing protein n=1 Tax=Dicentrarchus labrax TaxID=13489 RepID=A0A8C4GX81_DICLA
MLKTWAEAQSYCRETFTDLATVENQDDHDRLQSILQGDGEYAWIGLYDDLTRWKWTLGNADFNSDTDFSNWKSNEPNNQYSKENCTVMNHVGRWRDYLCSEQRPAVCYYEQGPSRYILVTTQRTWHEARAFCRSKYTDLVSVRNRSENDHIISLQPKRAWIGLHRNLWAYWSDQSHSTFTNWNEGQPDNNGDTMESCAAVNTTTGTWWDVDCNSKHYFICEEFKIRHKKTFKLKFQSEADLNDPAVQQQILEQLHAKLEKHGLPDFKLRWVETDGQTFHKQKQEEEEGILV